MADNDDTVDLMSSHQAAGRHAVIHHVVHDEGGLHGDDALPHRVLVVPGLLGVVKVLGNSELKCWLLGSLVGGLTHQTLLAVTVAGGVLGPRVVTPRHSSLASRVVHHRDLPSVTGHYRDLTPHHSPQC